MALTGLVVLSSGLVLVAGTPALWDSALVVAALVLAGFSFGVHNFWAADDSGTRAMNRLQCNKKMTILDGGLAVRRTAPTVTVFRVPL